MAPFCSRQLAAPCELGQIARHLSQLHTFPQGTHPSSVCLRTPAGSCTGEIQCSVHFVHSTSLHWNAALAAGDKCLLSLWAEMGSFLVSLGSIYIALG